MQLISRINGLKTLVSKKYLCVCGSYNLTSITDNKRYMSSGIQLAYIEHLTDTNNVEACHVPVFVIHGLFGSKRNWDSMGKALHQILQRRIIVVDCRNHGDSAHVNEMNYPVMSEDIVQLMDKLQIPKAHIIGHSMGGKVAMTLSLKHPHLVSQLVVVDVSPDVSRSADTSEFPKYIKAMRSVTMNHNLTASEVRKAVATQLEPTFKSKGELNFIISNIVKKEGQYTWQFNLDAIENNLEVLVGFPIIKESCDTRSLFVAGERSSHIREKNHHEIGRLFPNSSITTIAKAGHWVHAERPYDFLDVIKSFIPPS